MSEIDGDIVPPAALTMDQYIYYYTNKPDMYCINVEAQGRLGSHAYMTMWRNYMGSENDENDRASADANLNSLPVETGTQDVTDA